jgi:RNA polymerase sigma-70 factor (ECF subfamily)
MRRLSAGPWRGESSAFAELLRRHDQAVHAYHARRGGRHDADDLLSEVWLRAFEARASYDRGWPDARPWLYGIARNVLRAHWRRLGRPAPQPEPGSSDPWPDVDARIDATAQAAAVRRALAELPPGERDVPLLVTWRAGAGLPQGEGLAARGTR